MHEGSADLEDVAVDEVEDVAEVDVVVTRRMSSPASPGMLAA